MELDVAGYLHELPVDQSWGHGFSALDLLN
jgi:hypothetical protein